MRKFTFELKNEDDLIILIGKANGHKIQLALDTAASHSVIDLNVLLMLGYSSEEAISQTQVETSIGLDFFQQTIVTIDFIHQEVWLH